MKAYHKIDPEFRSSSPFLRRILHKHFKQSGEKCLDMPCGNGRNVFLLASHFRHVTAIDIEKDYLTGIEAVKDHYGNPHIETGQLDMLKNKLAGLNQYQLICNVHFFDQGLIRRILSDMMQDACLLIETPSCNGGNFIDLPNETELKALFGSNQVLDYVFKRCNHPGNENGRGSLKVLIKKCVVYD